MSNGKTLYGMLSKSPDGELSNEPITAITIDTEHLSAQQYADIVPQLGACIENMILEPWVPLFQQPCSIKDLQSKVDAAVRKITPLLNGGKAKGFVAFPWWSQWCDPDLGYCARYVTAKDVHGRMVPITFISKVAHQNTTRVIQTIQTQFKRMIATLDIPDDGKRFQALTNIVGVPTYFLRADLAIHVTVHLPRQEQDDPTADEPTTASADEIPAKKLRQKNHHSQTQLPHGTAPKAYDNENGRSTSYEENE